MPATARASPSPSNALEFDIFHSMKHLRSIFIFLFITSITIYAGGTASLVAKKSSTKGFSYSRSTRLAFIQECSESANQDICYCVLDKIQQQYSEKQYLKLDADLRKNINHPDFIAFISEAAEMCDAEYAESRSGGIGDGLAGLLASGGGGIATKAKGSIKTPSTRDVIISYNDGNRSENDIMRAIRQRTPGLRHIYNNGLKKKPGFQGKVTLKFTIAPDGEIISISIVSSTTGFNEFDNEIKNAVGRWTFSKIQSGNTTVSIPFTFSE